MEACFFAYFLEYALLFLDDNVDEDVKQLKFSLRVLLSICFFYCQFQPGVAYKSFAYKKKRVYHKFIMYTNLYEKSKTKNDGLPLVLAIVQLTNFMIHIVL